MSLGRVLLVSLLLALVAATPAAASEWLPHASDATWTYQFTDSAYNTTPSVEHVSVVKTNGVTFTLGWSVDGALNKTNCPDGANLSGWVQFQDSNAGILNGPDGWCGAPPPSEFPVLCASTSQCGNSLSSTLYALIWGSRAPILAEPLLTNTSWSATGGAQNDVSSQSDYVGTESISVPAFPAPVLATKVTTQITQAGALGDPYGSGVRTVWWVHGVGPVKIVFQHSGGTNAPITTSVLQQTNQTPTTPPADAAYFPMKAALKGTYRWTNAKHLNSTTHCVKLKCTTTAAKPTPEVESFSIDQAANGTAIAKFTSVSGPMKVAGAYQFTTRLDGVTSVSSATKAASLAKLPPLGPLSAPVDKRRHFFTPFDLMTFGFNPVLPAYPAAGATWSSDPNSRDFSVYGVTGTSRVVGIQSVTVPAGTFKALVVTSNLKQPGFPFGSGTRTMWFARDLGLVKLLFRHGDGSVSLVELIH
ncbi:MAG: hypothetical protein QOK22_2460 [Gaiellaceae bacterium]|nr:hypothetical protein [Gaiellaceae bacterium]